MRRPQIGKMSKKKYRTPLMILLGCVSLWLSSHALCLGRVIPQCFIISVPIYTASRTFTVGSVAILPLTIWTILTSEWVDESSGSIGYCSCCLIFDLSVASAFISSLCRCWCWSFDVISDVESLIAFRPNYQIRLIVGSNTYPDSEKVNWCSLECGV